jgi:hypothetical protein
MMTITNSLEMENINSTIKFINPGARSQYAYPPSRTPFYRFKKNFPI